MRAINSLGNKCSLKGVVGKIIGYPDDSLGGVVNFCTPHGTVIKTGCFYLSNLSDEEKILLEKYEKECIDKYGKVYDEEVIY